MIPSTNTTLNLNGIRPLPATFYGGLVHNDDCEEEGVDRYPSATFYEHSIKSFSIRLFFSNDTAQDSSLESTSRTSSDFHSDASSDSFLEIPLPDSSSLSELTEYFFKAISQETADLIHPKEGLLRDFVIWQMIEVLIHTKRLVLSGLLLDRGIDSRVVVEVVDREESETGVRGPVEVGVERFTYPVMPEDIHEPARVGAVEVTYEALSHCGVQKEQGHRIVRVESAVTALTKRIAELERDNRRLRGTTSVESQRVDRLQRGMSRMQRKLRQIRQF
ncbi:hypothetical protein Tco_0512170 [Tanacetum coccineum]